MCISISSINTPVTNENTKKQLVLKGVVEKKTGWI